MPAVPAPKGDGSGAPVPGGHGGQSPLWGVALSGGGVPGVAAHLGFLRAMVRLGVPLPPVMVGASAGGLVTGYLAIASGGLPAVVAAWAGVWTEPWVLAEVGHALHFLRPSATPGLLDLREALPPMQGLDSWKPRYGVMVSDITSGSSEVYTGSQFGLTRWEALTATAAVPGLFSGARGTNGHLYQDGGFFDDSPVDAARALGAERVLLVRIGGRRYVPSVLTAADLLGISLSEGLHKLSRQVNPTPADLTVHIPYSGQLLDYTHWSEDENAGAAIAHHHIVEIRSLAGV